jgi:endonuclease YncB( thermonuclease family)
LAENLIGQASIIDGDTLEIHGNRICLWGIDAPDRPSVIKPFAHRRAGFMDCSYLINHP